METGYETQYCFGRLRSLRCRIHQWQNVIRFIVPAGQRDTPPSKSTVAA
ncbi:hypothetical protein Hanom_Chr08g00729721 [Helianthus anomalus]